MHIILVSRTHNIAIYTRRYLTPSLSVFIKQRVINECASQDIIEAIAFVLVSLTIRHFALVNIIIYAKRQQYPSLLPLLVNVLFNEGLSSLTKLQLQVK